MTLSTKSLKSQLKSVGRFPRFFALLGATSLVIPFFSYEASATTVQPSAKLSQIVRLVDSARKSNSDSFIVPVTDFVSKIGRNGALRISTHYSAELRLRHRSSAPATTTTVRATTNTVAVPTTAVVPTTAPSVVPVSQTPTVTPPTGIVPTTVVPTTVVPTTVVTTSYPVGNRDPSEPSGYAPPSANALSNYSQSYVSDFSGTSLPAGWNVFTGQPGGDPGAQWDAAHVSVSNGVLSLNTYQDPSYNNEWVAGGLCQCGLAQTYGAYFVRSRVTGAGPTNVELLWPATNVWPPEIDFNETGGTTTGTSATVHWGSANNQDQRTTNVDMTQWHTYGVIWTPTTLTYTLDGAVWGTVTNSSEIPSVPMTLDLTQQTWCSSGFACPTAPQSMQIDWVAEYTHN